MDPVIVKEKVASLAAPCACGSGKPAFQCCRKGEVAEIENEMCPCGSGKAVKDCCMKSPETHQEGEAPAQPAA